MAEHTPDLANALGEGTHLEGNAFVPTPKPLRKIECANPNCRIEFKQARSWQRFCSVKCRNEKFWSEHKRLTAVVMPEQQPETKTTS
jgi:hypothetical protein